VKLFRVLFSLFPAPEALVHGFVISVAVSILPYSVRTSGGTGYFV
jgi:hypothetical protein